MIEYTYTDDDGDSLEINRVPANGGAVLGMRNQGVGASVFIPNADIPTVALELLKAAGHPALAELVEDAAREAAEKAEAEAAEKKLQERRDAVARRFENFRHLVDAYLTLEDKLDGASRD